MISEPRLEQRETQPYLAIRAEVRWQDFASVIDASFSEVFAWLGQHGIAPAGPPLIRYLVIDMATTLEVDLGVPVAAAVSGDARVSGGVLPAGRYAALVFTGDYSGLVEANKALLDWGAAQGLKWDKQAAPRGEAFGARLESYLTDPRAEADHAKWQTEVAIRLAD